MAKEKINMDKIVKEIEKIKKNFKGSEKNPYRVIIFNQACEWEHRAYPVLSLAMAVCADFWTNKGAYAVEGFHLDDKGNIVVDYHALRNF